MEATEVEILLIDDDLKEAESAIRILRKNIPTNKLIHLKDSIEANDFVFCTGPFVKRDINNQPKTIFFNLKMMRSDDVDLLDKISADERTKNIGIVVLASKNEKNITAIQEPYNNKGAMLSSMFDLPAIKNAI